VVQPQHSGLVPEVICGESASTQFTAGTFKGDLN